MRRYVPHPVLTIGLVLMWLLLNHFSLGHLVLGTAIALVAGWAMAALRPHNPRIRGWHRMPGLALIIVWDILCSNLQVGRLILSHRRGTGRSGFVEIPLTLRDPSALALLAIILTSMPGTAWLEYDPASGILLMHVLDLADADAWRETVKNRYERPLREIFE